MCKLGMMGINGGDGVRDEDMREQDLSGGKDGVREQGKKIYIYIFHCLLLYFQILF